MMREKQRQQPQSGPGKEFDQPAVAVDAFLASLLAPVQEYHPSQEVIEPQAKTVVLERKVALAPAPVPVQVVAPAPVVEQPVPVTQTITPPMVAPVIEPPSLFREGPFQALFFRAGGLEFVVPLIYLDAIIRWQARPTKLPGQPSWHRGVLEYRDRSMALVDFAQLVMPDKGPSRCAPGYILSIEDGRFGLVCESILKPEALVFEQVQWRSSRPDRGWLAGIVRERLASVVDIEELRLLLLPDRKWHA